MTPIRRPRHLRRLLALGAVLPVVVFGACGGSDDDGATAASKASATTTTAAADDMGGASAPATGDAVKIAGFAFSPATLQVKAGTKVTFTNEDEYEHTATADDGSFDSEHLKKGDTFEFTFDKPGTYAYKCDIHNSMTGKVVVQ
jgi:plastocyanin